MAERRHSRRRPPAVGPHGKAILHRDASPMTVLFTVTSIHILLDTARCEEFRGDVHWDKATSIPIRWNCNGLAMYYRKERIDAQEAGMFDYS